MIRHPNKESGIVELSVSLGIARYLYRSMRASSTYAILKRRVLSPARTFKGAFLHSESMKYYLAMRDKDSSGVYIAAQSALGITLLLHCVLDRLMSGKAAYGVIAILAAAMLTLYLGRHGVFSRILWIIRNSIIYRILQTKI